MIQQTYSACTITNFLRFEIINHTKKKLKFIGISILQNFGLMDVPISVVLPVIIKLSIHFVVLNRIFANYLNVYNFVSIKKIKEFKQKFISNLLILYNF